METSLDLLRLAGTIAERPHNSKLFRINDHCLRIAVNEDATYPWHRHPNTDELFIVLEGKLRIEFEDGTFTELLPNQTCCIKAGKIHRTIAVGYTVNLCFEADREDTEFIDPLQQ